MRVCIPRSEGRGAGLGNELFPWAKAFLAARELGMRPLHPAFGLHRRGYARYFDTPRYDWLLHKTLERTLPCFRFTEEEYRATGERAFGAAVRKFADARGLPRRSSCALIVEGMWGGFAGIREARPFVSALLHGARGVRENLHDLEKRLAPTCVTVAVHVRLGDFASPDTVGDIRGKWNVSIPLEWYRRTCRSIRRRLGREVQFLLVSDGTPGQLARFVEEFAPITTFHQRDTACSDLLAIAAADALVCSVSSFSMWGAFLSGRPYLWYGPHLQDDGRHMTLWGTGPDVALDPTGRVVPRGLPVDDSGEVPEPFLELLDQVGRRRQPSADLLMFGAVPSLRRDPRSSTEPARGRTEGP